MVLVCSLVRGRVNHAALGAARRAALFCLRKTRARKVLRADAQITLSETNPTADRVARGIERTKSYLAQSLVLVEPDPERYRNQWLSRTQGWTDGWRGVRQCGLAQMRRREAIRSRAKNRISSMIEFRRAPRLTTWTL